MRPVIAITCDLMTINGVERALAGRGYADAVLRAGGLPVLLQPMPGAEADVAARFDGFVFTGGDDPRTEPFGAKTHPSATPLHPERQRFETALLRRLAEAHPQTPVLGVCLGMQMMALVAGGSLNQHLPDDTPTHADHWEADHAITVQGSDLLKPSVVHSKHRQAVADPGRLKVIAHAHDGVIEAVVDPARAFYLGVQWHPERTARDEAGDAVFRAMLAAVRREESSRAANQQSNK